MTATELTWRVTL